MRSRRTESARRPWLAWSLASSLVYTASFACEPQSADPTGGETHFLRTCDPIDHPCEGDFNCLCGVCTTSCSVDMPCSNYPGSQCVTLARDTCQANATQACDVGCSAERDCAFLSSGHHCIDGFCRLASSVVPSSPEGGSDGAAASPPCDDSGISANEVVIVGDSFFATTHEVTGYLEGLARDDGVLSEGERYRDYSNLVSNSLAYPEAGLSMQYEAARSELNARVVIMNGGGADVLLGSCEIVDEQCPLMTDAALALEALLTQMQTQGVEQVVFVGYPDPVPDDVHEKMSVLRPLLEQECVTSPVPCHWLDLRTTFAEGGSDFVEADGLNPTSSGAKATAEAIWMLMRRRCIAQ